MEMHSTHTSSARWSASRTVVARMRARASSSVCRSSSTVIRVCSDRRSLMLFFVILLSCFLDNFFSLHFI
jgi:hypothetical protein